MTRLEDIFEDVEKVFMVLDRELKLLYANNHAHDLSKKIFHHALEKGKNLLPGSKSKIEKEVQSILEKALGGKEVTDILKCDGLKGEIIYFKYVVNPVFNKDGGIKALLVEANDYSGQLFVEQHIKSGNNLMDVVFKTIESSIVILDESDQIVRVNESFEQLTGYRSEEVNGRCFMDFVSHCDSQKLDKKLILSDSHCECSLRHKQGREVFVRLTGKSLSSEIEDFLIISMEDISPQKNLENELRVSRDRLSSLVDNLSLYLWSLDTDLRFVIANKAAIDIFKKSFDYDFEPGDHILDLYHKRNKTNLPLWMKHYHAVLETGQSQFFELAENFYGRFSHITVELHPITSKGELSGISCLVRNDTVKYLKNQLNEALSNFKSRVLNTTSINDLLWAITDEVLAHLHLEDAMIFMRKGNILQAKTAYGSKRVGDKRINSPLIIEVGKGITGNVAATGKSAIVNDTSADQRYFEVHFSAGSEIVVPIIVENEVIGLINCESSHKNFFKPIHLEILEEVAMVTAEKITRIVAERKLRKMEELNQAVLNSTPNSYLLINSEMKLESFNRTAFKSIYNFYGIEITQGMDFSSLVIAQFAEEFNKRFKIALKGKLNKVEKQISHPAYGRLWFCTTFAPAVNRHRQVFGVTIIMENITQAKESENLILTKNEELIKANRELDKFVYSVSHDLRSPVSSVMGINTLINMTDNIEEIQQYNGLIRESMERMDSFIHNILDYSRNSRVELKFEKVNLNELVDGILMDHSHMEGFNTLRIERDIQLEEIETDRQRLSIILSNLISNAVKYHDTEKEDQYIKLQINRDGEWVSIKVTDNGQGIQKEYQANLFQMFFTANLRAKGSGIGLYILKETIEALGGNITVQSELGEGSEFIAKLPLTKAIGSHEIPVD